MKLLGIDIVWWALAIETILLFVLMLYVYGILSRAKKLGMPVGRKKEGVLAILWGKVAKLRFVPLKGSNTVELDIGDKKATWIVDDLVTKPVAGLYGITATILHADSAQALDPDLVANLEGIDEDTEQLLRDYFKALRDLDELRSYLNEAEKVGNKPLVQKLTQAVRERESFIKNIELKLKLSPIIEKVVEGGKTVVVPQNDSSYLVIRPLNLKKLRAYARALPAPSLFATVQQYVNELKGKQTDVLKIAFAIVLVLIGVGVLLALKQPAINYEQLAQALKQATQTVPQNATVVVS